MFYGEDVSADTADKDISLQKLSEVNGVDLTSQNVGRICGRLFKNGEPNYWCKYAF